MTFRRKSDKSRDELSRLVKVLQRQNRLLSENLELTKKLLWEAQNQRKATDAIKNAITAPVLDAVGSFAQARQLGFLETLTEVSDRRLSFTRYGDGEIKMMLRPAYRLKFQSNSPALASALRNVLTRPAQDNLLVGFPEVYRDLHWTGVWTDVWTQLLPLLEPINVYGNSHVSRPIFFQLLGQEGVDVWRSIWDDRRIIIVTGEGSRFDLIPALFGNVADAAFEYSTAINAFSDLPRLTRQVLSREGDLVLVSLGPAGTVLTADLAAQGRQAIDVGHISDSYENVFNGGLWPEAKDPTR